MTYASDLFSWYAGSVDADVYFCPERHGTYYGGFYIKDAPAVGHEGYSISEQLTATAGAALCDSSEGYVTQSQAALMSSLLGLQRNNLYAGTTNIVQTRTQIATLLRSLLTSTASSDSVKAQVLALSGTYGDLDGAEQLLLRHRLRPGLQEPDDQPEDQPHGAAEVDHVRDLCGWNAFRLLHLHHAVPLFGRHQGHKRACTVYHEHRFLLHVIHLFERGVPNSKKQRGPEPYHHGHQDHGLPTQQVPAYGSKHRSSIPDLAGSRQSRVPVSFADWRRERPTDWKASPHSHRTDGRRASCE